MHYINLVYFLSVSTCATFRQFGGYTVRTTKFKNLFEMKYFLYKPADITYLTNLVFTVRTEARETGARFFHSDLKPAVTYP